MTLKLWASCQEALQSRVYKLYFPPFILILYLALLKVTFAKIIISKCDSLTIQNYFSNLYLYTRVTSNMRAKKAIIVAEVHTKSILMLHIF